MAVGAVLASGEGVVVGTGGGVELGTVVKVAVGKGGRLGVGDETHEAPDSLSIQEGPQAELTSNSTSRSGPRNLLILKMVPVLYQPVLDMGCGDCPCHGRAPLCLDVGPPGQANYTASCLRYQLLRRGLLAASGVQTIGRDGDASRMHRPEMQNRSRRKRSDHSKQL